MDVDFLDEVEELVAFLTLLRGADCFKSAEASVVLALEESGLRFLVLGVKFSSVSTLVSAFGAGFLRDDFSVVVLAFGDEGLELSGTLVLNEAFFFLLEAFKIVGDGNCDTGDSTKGAGGWGGEDGEGDGGAFELGVLAGALAFDLEAVVGVPDTLLDCFLDAAGVEESVAFFLADFGLGVRSEAAGVMVKNGGIGIEEILSGLSDILTR